jgi:predicted negative regulator of RcsB-dependent stress response
MAQYDRPPKEKPKGPDEFVSFFDHLVRYFYIHQVKFFIVLGLGVLFFAGYGIFLYYQNYRVKEFSTLYQKALESTGTEALSEWQSLAQKNPPKKLSEVISIQQGGILAAQGEWEKAAQAYAQAGQSREGLLQYLSQWSEGISLENAGKLDQALAVYQGLRQEKDNPFKDFAALGEAQVLLAQGKADQAQAILRELIGNESEAPAAVKSAAMNKLLALELGRSP